MLAFAAMTTHWVRLIIVANILAYFWQHQLPGQAAAFVLVPALLPVRPWTAFSYMFLHADFGHILFNMLSLFFFGPQVEERLGGRRFLVLYFLSGLTGAATSAVFTPYVRIVGASAAIFGVMLAFARFWPHTQVLIWGIIPVQARVLVVIMTVLALLGGARLLEPNVAHFAHLGGFLGGWLVLRVYAARKPDVPLRSASPRATAPGPAPNAVTTERWKRIPLDQLHPVNREEVERVLAKLDALGAGSLTAEERTFLDRFSAI
jgi:membrane associated rhomboid family serine protease